MSKGSRSSRHEAVDTLTLCASPRTTHADWASCLSEEPGGATDVGSPIDEFYAKHEGLTALGGMIGASMRPDLAPVLADQLLLGYVSATELYFRRLLAATARICPEVRRLAQDVEIAFGALDFYPRNEIEYSLTEKVTLTERGKVRSLLESRFALPVNQHAELERAIDQFETLCNLRHALVHSGGIVNSRNAKNLGHERKGSACRVQLGTAELQLAASVCVDLVRAAHDEVAKHTLWSWIRTGHLKGNRSQDRGRVEGFVKVFVSAKDVEGGLSASNADDLHTLVKSVRAAIAESRLKEVLSA